MSIPVKIGFIVIGLSVASVIGMGAHDLLTSSSPENRRNRSRSRGRGEDSSDGQGRTQKRRQK